MYVTTFSVEVKVPVSAIFKSIGYCFIAHPSCSSFQTCHRCCEIHPHTLKIGGINTQPGQCPEHKQVTQNHLKTTKKKSQRFRFTKCCGAQGGGVDTVSMAAQIC